MYKRLGKLASSKKSQGTSKEASVSKELGASEESSTVYIEILQERIRRVCRGHAVWLKEADKLEKLDSRGKKVGICFGANYWVTGKALSRSATSAEVLTDTPFQLIKLADHGRVFETGSKPSHLGELKNLAQDWIQELDVENARKFYAFPRSGTDTKKLQEFRLEDHVWIWRALGAVKDIVLEEKSKNQKLRPNQQPQPNRLGTSVKKMTRNSDLNSRYSPAVFQRHVLRRFTTENLVSKQRMLAVARSPVENRFYLHSRDTALLYKEHSAFFSKYNALWKATKDAQKFHEEPEDSAWGNPLRYTLDIVLGDSADRMAAKVILLQSLSANGLFPGALNTLTKEPELHYDEDFRDTYWHRTFEVPYVLWRNRDSNLFQHVPSNSLAQDLKESKVSSIDSAQVLKYLLANSPASESYPTQMVMKKRMPFNNVIVQQSIVELSDEWLYKPPNFFRPKLVGEQPFCGQNASPVLRGTVIDIPKTDHTKGYKDPLFGITLMSNESIYTKLSQERRPEDSKKRLIWITNPDTGTIEICCTIAEHEKDSLKPFFKRHEDKAKYFSDEVTATANLWTTEFHLSSYRVLSPKENKEGADMTFLGNETTFIERAGTGFRLVGDFFDRYWTCHVLGIRLDDNFANEENPRNISDRSTEIKLDDNDAFERHLRDVLELAKLNLELEPHKKPWKQRKVLELLLFHQMLGEITKRYQKIIEMTGQRLKELFPHTTRKEANVTETIISISNELFSKQLNNGAYLTFRRTWPVFQYSLQVLEEDLTGVLEKIDLWTTRKADRAPEEPRWTKNDERRYRAAITKLKNENSHAIRDLKVHLTTIQSLRMSLSSGLNSTRDELGFRNAENIRYFTYLTAVFLPLGFATGIWSMADASPRSESIKGMVITAVVTLLLTTAVLVNLQRLNEYWSDYTSRTFWEGRNEGRTNEHQEYQGDPSECNGEGHGFDGIWGIQLSGLRKRTEARKSNESLA
jgi:hypothetical protein